MWQAGAAVSGLGELDGIARRAVWDGVAARVVEGDRCAVAVVELDAGALVPDHEHANEQLGLVLSGTVTFTVGDETRELGPGGTWSIPGGTSHRVVAGVDGAVVIDVFSPPRADWARLETLPPQAPRWPA